MKVLLALVVMFAFGGYYVLAYFMMHAHLAEIEGRQRYVKDHGCSLIEEIPARSVGMMMHGETDVYKCPSGETIRIN